VSWEPGLISPKQTRELLHKRARAMPIEDEPEPAAPPPAPEDLGRGRRRSFPPKPFS
jgi:hypothetical protein